MTTTARLEISRLADQLERSLHGGAWHGPALGEALEGVDRDLAHWHPPGGVHSILELVAHVTYDIDLCRLRIRTPEPEETLGDDDWATPDESRGDSWTTVRAALDRAHKRLQTTLQGLDDARLDDAVEGSDPTVRGLLLGLLQHNAYHGGQIAIVRRLHSTIARSAR